MKLVVYCICSKENHVYLSDRVAAKMDPDLYKILIHIPVVIEDFS